MAWEASGNILEKIAKLLVTGFWGFFVFFLFVFYCFVFCHLLKCLFQKGKKFISVFKNRIEKLLPYTEEQGHL